MAVTNRLFGWDVATLALYADTALPADVDPASPSYDLLAIYTDARVRVDDRDRDGRATSEIWDTDLFISAKWSVEIASVVDSTVHSLLYNRLAHGRGPYWVQLVNGGGEGLYGRARFSAHDVRFPTGAQAENTVLKGVGPLVAGFLGGS